MDQSAHHHHGSDWKSSGAVKGVLGLLSIFLITLIVTEVREWRYIGSGIAPTNTISVQGEGEVFAVPDTALFSFSVIEEGETAELVQANAAEVANEALQYLKENGVEEKDIKTTSYNLYPRYEYTEIRCITFPCPQGERQLVGFELNQTFQVKVRDTEQAGELLSGVGSFGVENISSLRFTIDDEDDLVREARREALADAKEKAEALASDLGVRLVRVVNFNEYGSPTSYPRYETAEFGFGGAGDVKITPDLPVGENRITSQVNIVYEIR